MINRSLELSRAYEPLEHADFERLTQKTLFLLALARAARMSEIHAIDFSCTRFDSGEHTSAHLGLRWHFIVKNQLPEQPDKQFHVPALSSILGAEDIKDLFVQLGLHLYTCKRRRGRRR